LTAEATDGTTVKSAGVASISVFIDGRALGSPSGSCSPGPCTARTSEVAFAGRNYATGHHTITVIATDAAGNSASETFTMVVHPASPVAVGPGAVDPQSGEFSLTATDVSMGGGLTVGRSYRSRHLSAGGEGPLGVQWALSLGGQESLVKQSDGSMVLTDGSGAQTIFAPDGKGGFISPSGDANLALSSTPCETGQSEFMLKNAASATTTCFKAPSGGTGEVWTPSIAKGPVATDTVTYEYQMSKATEYSLSSENNPYQIASGPDGKLWFTAYSASKIGEITTGGSHTTYTLPAGSGPDGITAGPDGELWFADYLTSKIGKITTAGVVTEYVLPAGSNPVDIVTGSDKNLWFTELGTSKIGKITTAGVVTEYSLPANSEPEGIAAGPDNNLWFTDYATTKIGKITTLGAITEYSISGGGVAGPIIAGPDRNLWFAGESTIGKITTEGAVTKYSLPMARGVSGLVAGSDSNVWFTGWGTNTVGKISPSGVVSEYAVAPSSKLQGIASGPDGNLWFAQEGLDKIGKMTTAGVIVEPTEALAPVPAGVSCSPTLKAGCRALTFNYAVSATATGEGRSEWGDASGHLTRVYFTAYDPVSKAMKTVEVAHYLYDKQARLRAVWDPRISPVLQTTYGYDPEGHVTAMDPPGQEPWLLSYGTSKEDAGAGRLLKVYRPPASSGLWSGEVVQNTTTPTLTGSPAPGVRMAVSEGGWSGLGVASSRTFAFQWEDCLVGGSCTPIAGATNQNYTPTNKDLGYQLAAQVTASDGWGSASATSFKSLVVAFAGAHYTQTIDAGNTLNGVSCIKEKAECVVSDSAGKTLYSTNVSSSEAATWTAWSGPGTSPATAISCPSSTDCVMEAGHAPDRMYFATRLGGAWYEAFNTSNAILGITCPSTSFCLAGQQNSLFRYAEYPSTWEFKWPEWKANLTGVACLSKEFCAIADSTGNVHVATSAAQVKSTEWKTANVDGTTALNGIACLSTSSCLAIDGSGNVLKLAVGSMTSTKYNIDGTNSLVAIACTTSSTCVTVDTKGNIFTSVGPGESWTKQLSASETTLTGVACSSPSLCAATYTNGKITAFSPSTEIVKEAGVYATRPGTTIEYNVPLSGTGLPTMTSGEVEKWAQKDLPSEATAIFAPDEAQGWPASSYRRARIYYRDNTNRTVNVESPGGAISTSEYNAHNDVIRSLSADNRASALKEAKPSEAAKLIDTQSEYNSEGTELLSTLGPRHLVKLANGKEVLARSHTLYSYDEGAPSEGGPYRLATKTTQGAQVEGEAEQDIRTTVTSYSGQNGLGWKLRRPTSVTTDPNGLKLVHTTVYDEKTGNVIETRAPASKGAAGNTHDTQTVYYTTASNSSYPGCGEHPEWANMACETLPGAQPETPGLPNLPLTTVTYNMYGEPLKMISTVGSTTRTGIMTYDEAGRTLSSETVSTVGKALPVVTDKYSETTGALIEQSTTSEGTTQTLKSAYDTLGHLTSYTDADGNITKYEYESEGDARLLHVDDGKGTQAYTYDPTTGALMKLLDTQGTNALTFTASYDVEGNTVSEGYPNGMTMTYTRNPAGEATGLSYVKTTNCTENCTWFSDAEVASIHGQWLSQQSSLASESYSYDEAGRLTRTQETPTGAGCTTRIYADDEETNRTSLTTRPPGTGGVCSSEGGTVENHTYDSANRLTDTGVAYEAFGEASKLPAADAGGYELQSSFYADGQLEGDSQHGQSIAYQLDPSGRTRQTIDTGTFNSTTTSHYAGPGGSPSWTTEPVSGHWTRYLPGIGGLAAIETDTGEPVLQLQDLQGNIVATASVSQTATKLLSSERPTEYGVPSSAKPAKYSWLGGDMLPTEQSSGVVAMGARSYIPQLGRFLQTDPVPGGSANAYAYVFGDPINESDPSGQFAGKGLAQWATRVAGELTNQEVAAYEAALRAEAERKAAEAAAAAAAYATLEAATAISVPTEGGEEEEEGEEWEYAAYHMGSKTGHEEAHVESALLYQPLGGGTSEGQTIREKGDLAPCRSELESHAALSPHSACARNVSFLSKAWKWVKKHVKQLVAASVGFVSSTVVAGVTIVATGICVGATDGLEAFDCYKIGAFGVNIAAGGYIASYEALKSK
jgi:RHS repeat-associated protein